MDRLIRMAVTRVRVFEPVLLKPRTLPEGANTAHYLALARAHNPGTLPTQIVAFGPRIAPVIAHRNLTDWANWLLDAPSPNPAHRQIARPKNRQTFAPWGTSRPARMSGPTAKLGHKMRPCPATARPLSSHRPPRRSVSPRLAGRRGRLSRSVEVDTSQYRDDWRRSIRQARQIWVHSFH
jgi:hypothetical protein